jgi:hypothetical protein
MKIELFVLGLAVTLLSGCAQVSKVQTGDIPIRDRLIVTVEQPWNSFEKPINGDGTPTWTKDGITVDALKFYVGLKDGELIAPTPTEPKGQTPLAFKSTMPTEGVVELFRTLYSRDGSTFTLEKVTPTRFLGQSGFMFEWSGVRKADEVLLRGVAWGAVNNGQLYAITYTAPRLAFFPRGINAVEKLVATAKLRQ